MSFLNRKVGDYVVLVTADHGHTPPPQDTGAWPIMIGQLAADINTRFEVPSGETLIEGNVGVGLFLDQEEMTKMGVTESDVAEFVNSYTIADNWPSDDIPSGYAARADEQVFAASWPASEMNAVMRCVFGTAAPPSSLHG